MLGIFRYDYSKTYNGQVERNHNTYPTSLVYKFHCLTRRDKHQTLKETSTTKLVK